MNHIINKECIKNFVGMLGAILTVTKNKLGLDSREITEIIDLKTLYLAIFSKSNPTELKRAEYYKTEQ